MKKIPETYWQFSEYQRISDSVAIVSEKLGSTTIGLCFEDKHKNRIMKALENGPFVWMDDIKKKI